MESLNQEFIDLLWRLEELDRKLNNRHNAIEFGKLHTEYCKLFNLIDTTYPQYLDLI